MAFPSDKELLLTAFYDYIRKEKSDNIAREYQVAARQLIEYVEKQSPDKQWLVLVKDTSVASGFINSFNGKKETQDKKKEAIQKFQDYLKTHGRFAWFVAWIIHIQGQPWVVLFEIVSTLVLALITIVSFFGLSPEKIEGFFFPTATSTITNTPTVTKTLSPTLPPTITPTPSSTPTLTPTLTPTPNQTQVFLATQLPTAYPAFLPLIETKAADGSQQVWVPAGSFIAGDNSGIGYEDETSHQVYTDGFWIDRFLVTNKRFSSCPDSICGQPQNQISHKRPNGYYGEPVYANYPVIQVTWSQAEAFCQWAGGRLPTEAEWEKAAGWNPKTSRTFIYPWGDEVPDKTLANFDNVDLDTTEVNLYSKGISPVGAYDMAGNVWEWVFDWYGSYDLTDQINPVGSAFGDFKVIRGGSWGNKTLPTYLRVSNRGQNKPNHPTNEVGFRCIFTP